MKVAYSSDFHVDASESNREATQRVAGRIEETGADVVVIAGDAGNTLEALGEVLSLFAGLRVPKLFVAGNHDVWVEENPSGLHLDSRTKYEVKIPDVCEQMGFVDLSQEPFVFDGVGFVGSIGWYDYSFADPRLGLDTNDYWRGCYEEEVWWDQEMSFWAPRGIPSKEPDRLRDPDVCREMVTTLETHLRKLDNQVERVIAIVHTLPFRQTLPRSDPPRYLDAFTGSEKLGQTLIANGNVIHHIGGHKHLNGDWVIGRIHTHRRTLGRIGAGNSLDGAVENAIGVITL
jgi:predicted phosphohydrolase